MTSKDISRDDLVVLLSSMGIVLAKDNKLSVQELNKRLGQALDASQQFSEVVETTLVDPYALPEWPSDIKLFDATQRESITDAVMGHMAQPKKGNLAAKEETFKELRQCVLSMGYALDVGAKEIFFMGEGDSWGIHVRISKVSRLKKDVPLFFILYKELIAPSDSMFAFKDGKRPGPGSQHVFSCISDLERRTLLRLFEKNSKRFDPKYPAFVKERDHNGFLPSFVLPLCPIGMKYLGKFSNDTRCEVCGKKNSSRCAQCQSVLYCSKECQISDWKNHKKSCKSLKGGSWHTISLSDSPVAGKVSSLLNRLDSLHDIPVDINTGTNTAPPAIHSGKIFLAKFQVPFGPQPSQMLIYDQSRSFRLFWERSSNPKLFDEAVKVIGSKMKFYRWVKHTGGHQFEFCLDKAPEQDPSW